MIQTAEAYYPLYENKDKFIILVTGGRGCEHPDTPVMMADLTIKPIKDIRIGDKVMGDDGKPRNVLWLFHGTAPMYRVRQSEGEDYIVTDNHKLALLKGDRRIEIPVTDYIKLTENERSAYKGYRVEIGVWKPILVDLLSVEPIGDGEYCGISLDGNNLYIHPDGTVLRNSGKSFALGAFIERLTFETGVDDESRPKPHVVLYTRYTMTNASISVIPEVKEKIDLDGTAQFFHITKTDIVNNLTGGRIMFRGIRASSGNQTAKLKSIQGITTFVCDEAEEFVDEEAFDKLMLSIRQKGIQNRVIIIMNPSDANHFIYRRYIANTHKLVEYDGVPVQISTHPDVLHIHTSYLDNEKHLSPQYLDNIRRMKIEQPEKYAHVVMGQWADVAEGAIFKNWGIVDEFPAHAKKVACGLDLGFTNDASACIKCGIVDNDLYIDEQFYQHGMMINDLVRELKKTGCFIYSDSADPRLIQEISNKGIIIYPVAKPAGSVIAGIERIKDFDHVFVTKRSYNTIAESRNYVWAKNKDGQYINYPEDHDNHCFVGDTLVMTDKGEVPIRDIKVGDSVLTSKGYRSVLQVHDNGERLTSVFWIWCRNMATCLECTPDHMVKTTKGWKMVSELGEGDKIYIKGKPIRISYVNRYGNAPRHVYDLTVADTHEYYANNVLVHNCMDAIRYFVNGHILGQIVKPRSYNPDTLGIF